MGMRLQGVPGYKNGVVYNMISTCLLSSDMSNSHMKCIVKHMEVMCRLLLVYTTIIRNWLLTEFNGYEYIYRTGSLDPFQMIVDVVQRVKFPPDWFHSNSFTAVCTY